MGISYALYDEGAFRNELKGWDAANMEIAPESLGRLTMLYQKKIKLIKWNLENIMEAKKKNLRVIFNEKLFILFSHIIKRPQLID